MSTSAEIGRRPIARSRSCSHCGDGPLLHAADQPADEERAGLAGDVGREIDRDRAGEAAGHRLDRRGPQPAEAAGGEVAGDAGDAERVGAVRGDGDVDHRVERRHVDVARADRRVGGELDDAVVLVGELHLALGEHHAVALDAADLADLDRGVDAGDVVAGLRDHHLDAGPRVRRAADDLLLARRRSARGRPGACRRRGAGRASSTSPTVKAASRSAGLRHALDLEPEVGQREGDLLERGGGLEVLLEPGEGEFHAVRPGHRDAFGRFRPSAARAKGAAAAGAPAPRAAPALPRAGRCPPPDARAYQSAARSPPTNCALFGVYSKSSMRTPLGSVIQAW